MGELGRGSQGEIGTERRTVGWILRLSTPSDERQAVTSNVFSTRPRKNSCNKLHRRERVKGRGAGIRREGEEREALAVTKLITTTTIYPLPSLQGIHVTDITNMRAYYIGATAISGLGLACAHSTSHTKAVCVHQFNLSTSLNTRVLATFLLPAQIRPSLAPPQDGNCGHTPSYPFGLGGVGNPDANKKLSDSGQMLLVCSRPFHRFSTTRRSMGQFRVNKPKKKNPSAHVSVIYVAVQQVALSAGSLMVRFPFFMFRWFLSYCATAGSGTWLWQLWGNYRAIYSSLKVATLPHTA